MTIRDQELNKRKPNKVPMRIDAHQHFWIYNEKEYAWITDDLRKIRRNYEPDDLFKELKANQFDGSIAVQARQNLEETEWLLKLAEENEFIKGVVGWVDLRSNQLESQLERFCKRKKFVGVRHVVQDEPDNQFVVGEDFLDGISLLSKYNLTYDILVFAHQLPYSTKMVEKFPDQKFVLDHIAKPKIKDQELDSWEREMETVATYPNVYCKLSGMLTEADWKDWKEEDFKPYLDVVFGCFGTKRVMFGSDWPVSQLAGSYKDTVSLVESYIESYSEEDRNSIMGNNALNFYLDL